MGDVLSKLFGAIIILDQTVAMVTYLCVLCKYHLAMSKINSQFFSNSPLMKPTYMLILVVI